MKKNLLFCSFLCILFFANTIYAQNSIIVSLMDTTTGTAGAIQIKKADRDSLFKALNMMGYSYDVEYRTDGAAVGNSYAAYRTVILVETSFITASNLSAAIRDSLKSFLNSGVPGNKTSLIAFGGDIGYNYSRTGAPGQDLTLTQTMMKFTYLGDNGTVTTTRRITGVGVNAGQKDSLYGTTPPGFTQWNYYPDFVHPEASGVALYQYDGRGTGVDSVAGVGYSATNYVSAVVFTDPRYVVPLTDGSNGFQHVFQGVIDWVMVNGGYLPVELSSFTANV